ncbi:unnamed protein product [Lampetra fluviatilis]
MESPRTQLIHGQRRLLRVCDDKRLRAVKLGPTRTAATTATFFTAAAFAAFTGFTAATDTNCRSSFRRRRARRECVASASLPTPRLLPGAAPVHDSHTSTVSLRALRQARGTPRGDWCLQGNGAEKESAESDRGGVVEGAHQTPACAALVPPMPAAVTIPVPVRHVCQGLPAQVVGLTKGAGFSNKRAAKLAVEHSFCRLLARSLAHSLILFCPRDFPPAQRNIYHGANAIVPAQKRD